MRRIIASLDVGSSTIKLIIGEIFKNKLNVIACVDVVSRGIKKGYIVNAESAIESLKEVFAKAEEIINLPIKKIIVTVPSFGAECFYTEGSTTINNEDKMIKHQDLIRSMQASVYNKINESKDLISILPTSFLLDDVEKTHNPIGLTAEKLTIKAVAITVPKKNVIPIAKCLEKIGIEIIDVIIGPLGDYYEFKNSNTSSTTGAIINIGASKVEVSIFNKGILTAVETLDIGGENIDADLAYIYKLNKKDSIYVKENLGLAHKMLAQPSESITLEDKNGDIVKINQYDVSEIISSRLLEILNLAKKQINLLTKREISYIMVTGGVTELKDFEIILDEVFNRKAAIGGVSEIGIRNNKFSSVAGLIKYYNNRLKLRNVEFSIFNIEEQEELSGLHKKINISENTVLGKLFRYFFDN